MDEVEEGAWGVGNADALRNEEKLGPQLVFMLLFTLSRGAELISK